MRRNDKDDYLVAYNLIMLVDLNLYKHNKISIIMNKMPKPII